MGTARLCHVGQDHTSPLEGEAGLLGAAYAALLRWNEKEGKNETR